ncbi:hypothetical protein ABFS82_06G029700 [Erythranthe guttata]|uniref:uncharacterized protein LOC105971808 n=1 Tax=Erythranthe guttata TaxID=4155 RepID=UPI00064D9EFF|nr:PREDICTED: uncharacterized protein LOC105971808 [Erythranthe guttata]|eukprot:XP_012852160.1 PREDICTED: uncharacterized protein LOC105971808 [Erythranthe guttata]
MKKSNPVMEKRVKKILRHVKKLQEENAANQKLRIDKILRQMNKLQQESEERGKLEAMKEWGEEKRLKFIEESKEDPKLEYQKQALARKFWPESYCYHQCAGGATTMYNRDSTDSYTPQEVQKVKNYADTAIRVFNQRQAVEYSVVDVIEATIRVVDGFIVYLTFTAKLDDDDYEHDAETFGATVHYSIKGVQVTYVDLSST